MEDGKKTSPCKVEVIPSPQPGSNILKFTLKEGRNRQIRRMCEFLGYRVRTLSRIRIMNINLDLQVGKWRHLTQSEMNELNKLVATSTKEHQ